VEPPALHDTRLLTAYWEHSPIPKAVVSSKGTFLAVNPAWARLLGYSRGELIGNHFRTITHPSDINTDEAEVNRLLTDPTADGYSMVKRYLSKQGASVWVELHVIAIRDTEDRLEYFAVIVLPLPGSPVRQPPPELGPLGRLVNCYINLLTTRPRECIAALLLGMVAVGIIPGSKLIDALIAYFTP
jgi:PAS domain S-box-containing protein